MASYQSVSSRNHTKTPRSVTKHKANGVKTSMEHQKLKMHLRCITLVFRQQNKNYNLTFIMDNIIGCGGENRGSHGGFAFPMDNIIAVVIPCSPE
jgi:hypothetical protein